jgi:CubicO group peptidase (beta-lactamase class C family)
MPGNPTQLHRLLVVLIILCAIFLPAVVRSAEGNGEEIAFDARELNLFFDSIFAAEMDSNHIPGAVCAVVTRDSALVLKGYGWANLEDSIPVDPHRTIFRVASNSKVFTATAVMQAAANGVLDLDTDVNSYLKTFQLDNPYPTAVTLRHLFTHTAGLDVRNIARRTLDRVSFKPLGEYLAERMPPVVLPPGKVIVYSNHGPTLGGYIVETVTGIPFATYMTDSLFSPLHMNRSSFVRDDLSPADMAQGYFTRGGEYRPAPFEYTQTIPASMLMTTAEDVSRFLRMILRGGELDGVRVIDSVSIRQMLTRQCSNHPAVPGMGIGFYEATVANHRVWTHGGGFDGFHAQLYLAPQFDLGLFFAFNTDRGAYRARPEIVSAFFERFLPPAEFTIPPQADFTPEPDRFAGLYRYSRDLAYTTLEKLNMFMYGNFEVTSIAPDTLVVFSDKYVQAGPLLFAGVDKESLLGFMADDDGDITYMSYSPTGTYTRLAWYDRVVLHKIFLYSSMGLFALAAIVWWGGWLRKRKSKEEKAGRAFYIEPRLYIGLSGFFYLLFLIGMFSLPGPNRYGVPTVTVVLLWLPIIAVILTVIGSVFAARELVLPGRFGFRTGFLLLVNLFAILFIPFLMYWNLLGFNY